jgi:DNA (cytosine-5)-methyltransferase 1
MDITSIDLFSGPGGFRTGFDWCGIKTLIAVEWSYWTAQTYAASHAATIFPLKEYIDGEMDELTFSNYLKPSENTLLIFGDITKVTDELIMTILKRRYGRSSVDIVSGGAPCESFSLAGSRKEDDDRNVLFLNVLRIARAVDSRIFVFENVKGLFSKKMFGIKGRMYEEICKKFEEEIPGQTSYKLASRDKKTVLLKAHMFGVPQARERIILIGLNRKFESLLFSYPEPTHGPNTVNPYLTIGDAIMDLPKLSPKERSITYRFDDSSEVKPARLEFLRIMRGMSSEHPVPMNIEFKEDSLFDHVATGHLQRIIKRFQSIRPGENQRTAGRRLELSGDSRRELFPSTLYGARNRRLNLNETAFTVTSHCLDEFIHPNQDRALTPREVARLQSFPDWYQFRGPLVRFHSHIDQDLYEQIGDAVPPLLSFAI